eukprot:scaffold948_cov68-Phaeocystis_antarctica.AAC.3
MLQLNHLVAITPLSSGIPTLRSIDYPIRISQWRSLVQRPTPRLVLRHPNPRRRHHLLLHLRLRLPLLAQFPRRGVPEALCRRRLLRAVGGGGGGGGSALLTAPATAELQRGELALVALALDDLTVELPLVRRVEAREQPPLAAPRRAAGAVDEGGDILGHVVHDDVTHVREVEAARREVGAHEQLRSGEEGHGLCTRHAHAMHTPRTRHARACAAPSWNAARAASRSSLRLSPCSAATRSHGASCRSSSTTCRARRAPVQKSIVAATAPPSPSRGGAAAARRSSRSNSSSLRWVWLERTATKRRSSVGASTPTWLSRLARGTRALSSASSSCETVAERLEHLAAWRVHGVCTACAQGVHGACTWRVHGPTPPPASRAPAEPRPPVVRPVGIAARPPRPPRAPAPRAGSGWPRPCGRGAAPASPPPAAPRRPAAARAAACTRRRSSGSRRDRRAGPAAPRPASAPRARSAARALASARAPARPAPRAAPSLGCGRAWASSAWSRRTCGSSLCAARARAAARRAGAGWAAGTAASCLIPSAHSRAYPRPAAAEAAHGPATAEPTHREWRVRLREWPA